MKKIVFVFLLAALTFSCQKSKENSTPEESKAFEAERSAFFNNLFAPAEGAARIQATGAEFNAALMNDPKNFSMYAGNEVKAAANMGIYLSDLNYCVAYTQTPLTKEYFSAAHELSKAIGIEQTVLEFL